MDPAKTITELDTERAALKQQLTAPGISEAERIAIRKNIDSISNELIEWIKRFPPVPPSTTTDAAHKEEEEEEEEEEQPTATSNVVTTTLSLPPSGLTRVDTVRHVLRHVRVTGVRDIVKFAHVSDTFRSALEASRHSAMFWRRIASRLADSSALTACFKRNAFAWIAHSIATVGQLDVSVMREHPIIVAAYAGAVDVVRVCLAAFLNSVDTLGRYSETALHGAAGFGHVECVRELLDAGADVTVLCKHGWTALHHAAERGHVACVRLFIEHPDYELIRDTQNPFGKTARDVAKSDEIRHMLRK